MPAELALYLTDALVLLGVVVLTVGVYGAVSYTHLTLPTNREV